MLLSSLLLTAGIKILSCLSCQAIERQGRLNNQSKETEAVLKALEIPENSQEILTINKTKQNNTTIATKPTKFSDRTQAG